MEFRKLLSLQQSVFVYKSALSGDIEAMFNQVDFPEEDQVALRFSWRRFPGLPVEVYQYVRHMIGAKSVQTCSNYAH